MNQKTVLLNFDFFKIGRDWKSGYFVLFQPFYPLSDVAEHFGRDGLLNLSVLIGQTRGTMLEKVVQPRVFFYEVMLRLWQQAIDSSKIERGNDLTVAVAVEGEDRAARSSDVGRGVVVDKPLIPRYLLDLWILANLFCRHGV